MIKFNKLLTSYDCVLSFDLAKHKTGYALVDIKNNKVLKCGMIDADETAESLWFDVYKKMTDVILSVRNFCKESGRRFFVTKEKLPTQAGRFTTIASLQGLAQVHAIWELCCVQNGVEVYDYEGIHSVSVKAFYSRNYAIEKPQKEDIAKCVEIKYEFQLNGMPYDVTDAIAVTQTLVEYKWNQDIKDEIKEIKKDIKKYKTEKKKERLNQEIANLKTLIVEV